MADSAMMKKEGRENQMARIDVLETVTIFTNPMPHLRSRHGCFPGVVELPSRDLLALITIGEAFESVDLTTWVARSNDSGRSWQLEHPLYDKSTVGYPTSDVLKPTVLRDGTLIAIGYRFHRHNPDEPMGNLLTNGMQPADNIVSFSRDEGRTWSIPDTISLSYPEAVELSGPCLELRSGDLLAVGALFPLWDGTYPSGQKGVALRSSDKGRTWVEDVPYFSTPDSSVSPYETRLCEMQDGRLVSIAWAFEHKHGRSLNNHVTVSHDDGHTWSSPMDIGVSAQSSSLIWLGGDLLLTIHAHREGEVGLYVRVVDFANDQWRVVAERNIWDGATPLSGKGLPDLCKNMKFGQPSLVPLSNGEILAPHWCIEDGQGKVLAHRLVI